MRLLVTALLLVLSFTGSPPAQTKRTPKQRSTTNPSRAAADAVSQQGASFSSKKIPDVRISDQNGKQLNFYSDLVKGNTVAINFIFTTCTNICPPLTATFRRVQQNAIDAISTCT